MTNNEKIAVFMNSDAPTVNLEYNYSWDALMPVVYKITKLARKKVQQSEVTVGAVNITINAMQRAINRVNLADAYCKILELIELLTLVNYAYSIPSNNIWTSFDNGIVKASSPEQALILARTKLYEDFGMVNNSLEIIGLGEISFDDSQIEIVEEK